MKRYLLLFALLLLISGVMLGQEMFTVTASVSPASSGTVNGGATFTQTYTQGETCTLTAVASTGYTFSNWTEEGNPNPVSTSATYSFQVNEDRTLVANFTFTPVTFTINASVSPASSGTVNGGATFTQTYTQGETCTLTAVASMGYTFSNWTEEGNPNPVSTNATYSFQVNEDRTLVANFTFTPVTFTINASVSPAGSGTVNGGATFTQTYTQGETCTLTAVASMGYTFSNWTEEGNPNPVSTNATYSFQVNEDRTLVANFTFTPVTFTINASVSPAGSGTVNGGATFTQTYTQGETCTLTAVASTGYTFSNWTEEGNPNPVSTNATYSFQVNEDRTLVANFTQQLYTITVSASPNAGGTVTGGGNYQQGQQCTVSASANTGYAFTNWTENGSVVSTNASYSFTVTGNRTLVAHFSQLYTITVSASPSAGGTVTGGGNYQQGQQCTVSASANSGYAFTNWTENGNVVSTNASYSFTVTGNRTLVAHFAQLYTITVSASPSAGGTVTGGGNYQQGQQCTVSASANSGYAFTNWTENGNVVSTNASYSFTVTRNRLLVAHFTSTPQGYTINVSADPDNGGTVTGGGNYQQGQQCTVSASANSGYAFTNWTENGTVVSTNASYSFTVSGNRTLIAHFVQLYTITVSASPSAGGTVTGGGNYQQGQQCTVSASANSGYAFTNWTENGNVVSTNASYTFTVTGNRALVAHFVQLYTISVSASPNNGGTVTGGGNYQQGQQCTVHATASSGYVFTNWTENGNVVSNDANYTFPVTSNRTLVAHFAQLYTISVSASPTQGGTVSGGGQYQYGQQCTVLATASNGYVFTNWTENGNVVSTEAHFTFTVTGNRTLVAHFNRVYTIKVLADPEEGGEVSGNGTYQHGQSCTVIATSTEGYRFVRWTENDDEISTDPNYTFTVTSNRILVAKFEELPPNTYYINVSPNPPSGGTVTGGGSFPADTTITVRAIVNEGYRFTNWTENGNIVSNNADYTFTVTGNRNLIANFTQQQYNIEVSAYPADGGDVSGGGTFHHGESHTVHASANQGFTFTNWTENDSVVSTLADYHFFVERNRTLVANFEKQGISIEVSANPEEGGTVSGGGVYVYGINCTVQATPNDGFEFENWTENGLVVYTERRYTFLVENDRNLVANFTSAQFSINVETSEGGSILVDHDEATAGTAITITVNANAGYELDTITVYNTDNPSQTVQVTNNEMNYEFTMPNYSVTVKAEFKQQEIDTPAPICSGESLDLDELVLPWFPHGYWQLSPTEDFEQGSTIIYTNQALDASYDGWYLRYHGPLWNSNIVPITVYSMAEMTLGGEESASLDQEVEYIVIIEGQDNYADYSFNWSVSDGQADVTILDNSCKVIWKTTGTQQVSVTVTDETTGCTNLLVKDVNVTACIDNLQEIVAKDHKEGSETYVLILVYPNPNNEDYSYQWLYSSDGEIYHELTEGTAKKQYYYKGGRLKDGYYKVRISKDGCSEETLPYHVNYGGRLHIYPNPSHRGTGVVVVNDSDSPAQLTIYSTNGRVLHTQIVTSDQATIGINLPQGVYVAYLTTGDGYTKIGKLIIQ